jgi:hypothetical protein
MAKQQTPPSNGKKKEPPPSQSAKCGLPCDVRDATGHSCGRLAPSREAIREATPARRTTIPKRKSL